MGAFSTGWSDSPGSTGPQFFVADQRAGAERSMGIVAAEQQYLSEGSSRGEVKVNGSGGAWLPAAMDEDLAVAVEQQCALLGLVRLGRLSRLAVEVAQQ